MQEDFLWMPRRAEGSPERTEQFLAGWAARGYLLLGVTADACPLGDPMFLQNRSPVKLLAAAEYWQQQGALHERLRRNGLLHLPVGLTTDDSSQLALAWLVPAPARGYLSVVGGFKQESELSGEQRLDWLAMLAKRLLQGSTGMGQRALLQPPSELATPARWHYGSYLGDEPVKAGTFREQVVLLLASLPRYACTTQEPGRLPNGTGEPFSLVFNRGVASSAEGMQRVNGHCELLFSTQQQPGHTKVNDSWW